MEFMTIYWPVLLLGVLIGAIVGYLIFRPRQRVTLSKDIPVRPHMTGPARRVRDHEGRGLGDEAAAAASDVAGHILSARVHDHLPGASGPPDDLVLLKGVGPKLATMLNDRGIIRFDQIASLSPHQVGDIDVSLGAFRGRFERDRIVEQADYLARGDLDGYRVKFGNL
ncbi:MAG: hypothetical protein H0W65_05325 [Sphingomonas sp.]|uniref:hypothetical protein n=1 Tax=Sphingomonas sp. TaxID=28214 RepID=UPI00182C427F|nr:hypothetical protein [Sphingomonas sp.]MBA3667125.1 hypothetical protein [Sphingomonas sp.]